MRYTILYSIPSVITVVLSYEICLSLVSHVIFHFQFFIWIAACISRLSCAFRSHAYFALYEFITQKYFLRKYIALYLGVSRIWNILYSKDVTTKCFLERVVGL